jgi:hypothetical protein
VRFVHRGCGGEVDDHRMCEACGAALEVRDVITQPGPGADAERTAFLQHARNR